MEKTQLSTLNQETVMEHLSPRKGAYLQHVRLLQKGGTSMLKVLPHLLASLVQNKVKRKQLKQIKRREVHQWMAVRMGHALLMRPVMMV